MLGHQFAYSAAPVRRVREVQFGILSPEEIKAYSVAKIEHPEVMDETTHKPKIGGLMDPHMGTIDRNFKCQTCGEGMSECPGHFGHIELARPVFHPGFIVKVKKILECICVNCGRLKADSSDADFAHRIRHIRDPKARMQAVWGYCKGKMICEADEPEKEGEGGDQEEPQQLTRRTAPRRARSPPGPRGVPCLLQRKTQPQGAAGQRSGRLGLDGKTTATGGGIGARRRGGDGSHAHSHSQGGDGIVIACVLGTIYLVVYDPPDCPRDDPDSRRVHHPTTAQNPRLGRPAPSRIALDRNNDARLQLQCSRIPAATRTRRRTPQVPSIPQRPSADITRAPAPASVALEQITSEPRIDTPCRCWEPL